MTRRQTTLPSPRRARAPRVIDLLLPRAGTIIPEAGARNRALTAPAVIVDPLALVPELDEPELTIEVLHGWDWQAGRRDTIPDEAAPLRGRPYAIAGVAGVAGVVVGVALALAW
jgi:hypothetical protein